MCLTLLSPNISSNMTFVPIVLFDQISSGPIDLVSIVTTLFALDNIYTKVYVGDVYIHMHYWSFVENTSVKQDPNPK